MIHALELQRGGLDWGNSALNVEEFCNRWKTDLYAFCKTFIGDTAAAEDATCEVLLAFCRRKIKGEQTAIRARIMRLAIQALNKYRDNSCPPSPDSSGLEVAILRLPRSERALVIMRSLLRMDWVSLTLATALPYEEVHALWVCGVSHLNEILQSASSNEQH